MKCPNCKAEINELTEVCPKCKINLDEFEEKMKETENESNEDYSKTSLLSLINFIQIIGFITIAIIHWSSKDILQGFIFLAIGLVIFAFVKGFVDIIDILDSINKKIG